VRKAKHENLFTFGPSPGKMSSKIKVRDKEFSVFIPADKIRLRIAEMGETMSRDLNGTVPLFISVLSGAFLFSADLLRTMTMECEISFVRVSSYDGVHSTGVVKDVIGLKEDIRGRTVVILEDIIDTGETAMYLINELKKQEPKEIKLASLLLKPKALKHDLRPDYVGFEVPNDFLMGYGLDYDGLGRNLKDIYTLI
jgi:hypoxanthine phosphoribosyltransferase